MKLCGQAFDALSIVYERAHAGVAACYPSALDRNPIAVSRRLAELADELVVLE